MDRRCRHRPAKLCVGFCRRGFGTTFLRWQDRRERVPFFRIVVGGKGFYLMANSECRSVEVNGPASGDVVLPLMVVKC